MIKTSDNFISKENFKLLKDQITSSNFPWYYQEGKVHPKDKIPSLTHVIFSNNKINSRWYEFIIPIIEKCNVKNLVRIKANLDIKKNENLKFSLHTDVEDGFKNCKTGIFYINDNNGGTFFENGKFIKSVSNRFIFFPAKNKHGTQIQTDKNCRIVINFVWY